MKKIILLSMLVMALFVNCTSTEKKAVTHQQHTNNTPIPHSIYSKVGMV